MYRQQQQQPSGKPQLGSGLNDQYHSWRGSCSSTYLGNLEACYNFVFPHFWQWSTCYDTTQIKLSLHSTFPP